MTGKMPVIICQCVTSYHLEPNGRGGMIAVLDEIMPDLMTMVFGVCPRCGLPYYDRSELGEPPDVER